jgi:hypothetical protein
MKAEFLYDERIAENTGALRKMTRRHGSIFWQMAPGTDEAAANGMYMAAFHYDANVYIKLYFSANNELKMEYKDRNATAYNDTWDCTGALAHDGTTYEMKLEFSPNAMTLFVDNAEVASLTNEVDFSGCIPDKAYWGTDSAAANAYTSTTFTYPNMSVYWYA